MGKLKSLKEGIERAAKTLADYKTRVVYHGSPHDFDAFDLSKIGTGEGAQAYGHGLYFTESDEVAKYYRDSLSPKRPIQYKGLEINRNDLDAINYEGITEPEKFALRQLYDSNGDVDDAREILLKQASNLPSASEWKKTYIEAANSLDEISNVAEVPKSKLYRAEIPTSDYMLDWDKPLSEQPEGVKAALEKAGLMGKRYHHPTEEMLEPIDRDSATKILESGGKVFERRHMELGDDFEPLGRLGSWNSDDLYVLKKGVEPKFDYISGDSGASLYLKLGGGENSSEFLKKLGIVGINYIGDSSGVRNAVVFDDKLVRILEKGNVDPRLLAALGITAGGVAMAMPQDAEAGVTDDVVRAVAKAGDLDMSQAARMARAAEQGFDTGRLLYRGTTEVGETSLPHSFEAGGGVFTTDNPDVAQIFRYPREYGEVITEVFDEDVGDYVDIEPGDLQELYGKKWKNPLTVSDPERFTQDTAYQSRIIKEAKEAGHDAIIVPDVNEGVGDWTERGTTVVALNPADLRSIHAKFDPANIGKNDLLGAADPRILAPTAAAAAGAGMLAADPAAAFDYGAPHTLPGLPSLPPEYNEFARRRASKRGLWDQVKEAAQATATVGSAVAGGLVGDLSRVGGYINPFMPVERTEAGARAIEDRMQYIPSQPNRYLEGMGGFIDNAAQDLKPITDALPESIPGQIYNALPERVQGLLRIGADWAF